MHYSSDPARVRVDIFKPSGKWYETVSIVWLGWDTVDIHKAFKESIEADPHAKRSKMGFNLS